MSSISCTLLIHEKHEPVRCVLMKWVMVTDARGNRRPQMYWRSN